MESITKPPATCKEIWSSYPNLAKSTAVASGARSRISGIVKSLPLVFA